MNEKHPENRNFLPSGRSRGLNTLTDDEIVRIIESLYFGYFQVNSREVNKIESSYLAYPGEETLYLRIFTRTHPDWHGELPEEDQIFGTEFNMDEHGEIFYTPMNRSVYTKRGLDERGITHDICVHLFNFNAFYKLLNQEFGIWENERAYPVNVRTVTYPEWRMVDSELIQNLQRI